MSAALLAMKALLDGASGGMKGYVDGLNSDSNQVDAQKSTIIPSFKFESKKEESKEEVPAEKKGEDSDSRLKDIYPGIPDNILKCFSVLNPILYKYNEEGQSLGNDDKEHFGVTAQDLKENPLTESTVKEGDNGYLEVDGGKLSLANTATLAELAKRVLELENIVKRNGLM